MVQRKAGIFLLTISVFFLITSEFGWLTTNSIFSFLYCLISLYVFSLFLYEDIREFNHINLSFLFLVGAFTRLIIPEILDWCEINSGNKLIFIFDKNVINDYFISTVIWMNICYIIIYITIKKYENSGQVENLFKLYLNKYNFTIIATFLFFLGASYTIIASFIPVTFIPSFIVGICSKLSELAILVLVMVASISGKSKQTLTIFVVLQIIISSWFGFYKNAILMPFCYYLLYLFLYSRYNKTRFITPKFCLLVMIFLFFADTIVYPFVSQKREESGFSIETGMATRSYSNIDIFKEVISGKIERSEDVNVSSRTDAIIPNAFFYGENKKNTARQWDLLIDNLEILVPRFMNPKKHASNAGRMAFSYAESGNFQNYQNAYSNNYVGLFAGAYLIGGALLALFMSWFNGFFLAKYFNYLSSYSRNLIAACFLMPLILESITCFEEVADGGIQRVIIYSIYMILVSVTSKILRIKKIRNDEHIVHL